ncbi:MAG TPA: Hsp70 family protein [Polyangiaceae bacterium]|nr:Hsp70 family protein [Polyangiaceae bacterium]
MTGLHVGIDLGTTYSLVSVVVDGEPRVIKNGLGELLTPSAVHVAEDGTVLVGSAARAKAVTAPNRTALSFKRDMGTNRRFELGGQSFTPEELSALVLQALKQDVETEFGCPIDEAVVTVPAYFGELQRRATRAACDLAGIPVERIINEPTAAALAYGLHEKERELCAAVLDLGGGTFDVTILELMEGVVEIQASAGDLRLGGDDFAAILAAHCQIRLTRDYGIGQLTGAGRARFVEACELAKKRLSSEEQTRIALPALPTTSGTRDVELSISRAEFEEACLPLVSRMTQVVQRALRDANREPRQIDEVLLVGGATRMPCVVRLASQLFSRLPLRVLPPDEAVALGAAIQVALKKGDSAVGDLVVTDIAPFTLGVASGSHRGSALVQGLFSPIIERGTVLPVSRVENFATLSDNQTRLLLEVYQGEHSLCAKNQKLGQYELNGIPAAPAGTQVIAVRFTYDMNGVLDVDATICSTGQTDEFTIESVPGRLSKKELEQARARFKRLKFHPRDALPNVTALARADALYVELTGEERAVLGGYINQLRVALEQQGSSQITTCRERLLRLVSDLDRRA